MHLIVTEGLFYLWLVKEDRQHTKENEQLYHLQLPLEKMPECGDLDHLNIKQRGLGLKGTLAVHLCCKGKYLWFLQLFMVRIHSFHIKSSLFKGLRMSFLEDRFEHEREQFVLKIRKNLNISKQKAKIQLMLK